MNFSLSSNRHLERLIFMTLSFPVSISRFLRAVEMSRPASLKLTVKAPEILRCKKLKVFEQLCGVKLFTSALPGYEVYKCFTGYKSLLQDLNCVGVFVL